MDALETIVAARKIRLEEARTRRPLAEIEKLMKNAPPPRDFFGCLVKRGTIGLIAEMKRKSPSAGLIRENYDVAQIAVAYEKGGADALSVLTEEDSFGGAIEDVERVRGASPLPILRKDFIFDIYQVYEARAFGADAVLLISDMLKPTELAALVRDAQQVGLEPLVEVFTEDSVAPAVDSGARLIGINTRNLRTLEMHRDNVARLKQQIPSDRAIVAESGIKSEVDVQELSRLGVSAMLVGESLLKEADAVSAVRRLKEAGARVG